jgi:hypothetical protein
VGKNSHSFLEVINLDSAFSCFIADDSLALYLGKRAVLACFMSYFCCDNLMAFRSSDPITMFLSFLWSEWKFSSLIGIFRAFPKHDVEKSPHLDAEISKASSWKRRNFDLKV